MNPENRKKKKRSSLLKLLGISFSEDPTETVTLQMTDREAAELPALHGLPENLSKRYEVIRLLGNGGYGIVFLVRDQLLGRLCALKLLKSTPRQQQLIFRHFLQEARIAGQLDHENIVLIHNLEISEDCACIVMEFLSEGSLSMMIAERGQLKELEALKITQGILCGLAAAHQMRVTHRDIKPENILFDAKMRPKISDFGIAHLPVEEGGIQVKEDSGPVGTPVYMAPEQLRGASDIDGRCDLYACGTMLYEMLCGRRMVRVEKDAPLEKIANIIVSGDAPSLSSMGVTLDEESLAFIEKLTQPDVELRYQSANEALADLKPLIEKLSQSSELVFPEQVVTSGEKLLEDVMRMLLIDGLMSTPERRDILARAQRLSVSPDRAREIEERIRKEMSLPSIDSIEAYESALCIVAGDELTLTDAQQAMLMKTAKKLGLREIECQLIEEDVLRRKHKQVGPWS